MLAENTKNKIPCLDIEKNTFSVCFLLFGIVTQVATFLYTNDSALSLISGISGIVSVILCSQRKMLFYFFSFLQIITFAIICYQQRLYGKIVENAFYFITMLYGLYEWRNHINHEIVQTRKLNSKKWAYCVFQAICGTIVLHPALLLLGGSSVWLDSVTTTLAIIAQILMILRYRENWYFWLIVDIVCVILWFIQGNYCMMMQYVFGATNCLYGLYKWN